MRRALTFHLVFWALVAINVALIWTARLLPFVDLPFHLAAATILRFFDDPGAAFARYFRIDDLFPEPNVVHLLVAAAPVFPDVETANRLLYTAYAIGFPSVILASIQRVGGNRWFALLAFPLLYSHSVVWGLAGFTMAIPLVLGFSLVLTGAAPRLDRGRLVAIAVMLAAMFAVHALATMFSLLILALFAAAFPQRGWRPRFALAISAVPAVVLLAWWWFGRESWEGPTTGRFLAEYYAGEYWTTLARARARILVTDNRQLYGGRAGTLAAFLISCGLAAPLVIAAVRRPAALLNALRAPRMRGVLALFSAAAIAVAAMPDRIPGEPGLHERFAVFLFAAAILASSAAPWPRWSGRHALVICAFVAAYQAARIEYFVAFARESRDFTREVFPEAPPAATLLGLVYEGDFRGHPVYTHLADYFTVWEKGIAVTEAAQFRFGTVRTNPKAPPLPRHDSSPGEGVDFGAIGAQVDYLLVRGLPLRPMALDAVFEIVRSSGAWRLYRSRRQDVSRRYPGLYSRGTRGGPASLRSRPLPLSASRIPAASTTAQSGLPPGRDPTWPTSSSRSSRPYGLPPRSACRTSPSRPLPAHSKPESIGSPSLCSAITCDWTRSPATKCSWMMRSSTSGSHPPYQTPSG
jgi:hypothetical protein